MEICTHILPQVEFEPRWSFVFLHYFALQLIVQNVKSCSRHWCFHCYHHCQIKWEINPSVMSKLCLCFSCLISCLSLLLQSMAPTLRDIYINCFIAHHQISHLDAAICCGYNKIYYRISFGDEKLWNICIVTAIHTLGISSIFALRSYCHHSIQLLDKRSLTQASVLEISCVKVIWQVAIDILSVSECEKDISNGGYRHIDTNTKTVCTSHQCR